MDFLSLLWGVVAITLVLGFGGAGLVLSFWLRCDLLQDQKETLQHLLDSERDERSRLAENLMELQAALRAERFHVEQLQRKLELLKLPDNNEY
ncbi:MULTISPECIES: hypothetical protein [Pseudomonas]|uniref:hypothetical protein n=1 Tax=Pseudomonas TaxID=286 RepID=UPI00226F8C94|nr:hypothetical protein [Pseudomonas citronellolis]WAB91880.1 hypothetical protein OSS47_27805 [Pseudomonas citronellolis]